MRVLTVILPGKIMQQKSLTSFINAILMLQNIIWLMIDTMLNCPLKMLKIKRETRCFLKEAEIFSLQVLLQPHQQETLTASLEMQRTR